MKTSTDRFTTAFALVGGTVLAVGLGCSPPPTRERNATDAGPQSLALEPSEIFKKGTPVGRARPGARSARSIAQAKSRRVVFDLAADLSSPESFRTWVDRARPAFVKQLGAEREEGPLKLRIIERVRIADIERTKIQYSPSSRFAVSAFVYRPSGLGEPAPAVLLLHGHHNDGKLSAAVTGRRLKYGEFGGALDLARAGYIVMTPDIRSFGESGNRKEHGHLVKIMLLDGRTAMGAFLADAWRALDVMTLLRGVDTERLGVAGLSLGGQLSIYLAATDARIKAAVVQGYLASHKGTHINRWHCICQYMPGMGGLMDISDAASLTAPRPMLFVLGRKDGEFPLREAKRAFGKIKTAYGLLDAAAHVRVHEHPGRHEWLSEPAVAFFDEFLKTDTSSMSPPVTSID